MSPCDSGPDHPKCSTSTQLSRSRNTIQRAHCLSWEGQKLWRLGSSRRYHGVIQKVPPTAVSVRSGMTKASPTKWDKFIVQIIVQVSTLPDSILTLILGRVSWAVLLWVLACQLAGQRVCSCIASNCSWIQYFFHPPGSRRLMPGW